MDVLEAFQALEALLLFDQTTITSGRCFDRRDALCTPCLRRCAGGLLGTQRHMVTCAALIKV